MCRAYNDLGEAVTTASMQISSMYQNILALFSYLSIVPRS